MLAASPTLTTTSSTRPRAVPSRRRTVALRTRTPSTRSSTPSFTRLRGPCLPAAGDPTTATTWRTGAPGVSCLVLSTHPTTASLTTFPASLPLADQWRWTDTNVANDHFTLFVSCASLYTTCLVHRAHFLLFCDAGSQLEANSSFLRTCRLCAAFEIRTLQRAVVLSTGLPISSNQWHP